MSEIAVVGLGSNLGNRLANLKKGLAALEAVMRELAVSSVYETEPVGGPPQPPYLNMVALGRTELSPEALLHHLQQAEAAALRERTVRFGPRTLDLDLLWYGGQTRATEALTLPHPRLTERRFVLEPLYELWPDFPLRPASPAVWAQQVTRLGRLGPDPELAEQWRQRLNSRWVGQAVEYHPVLDSTNHRLREWVEQGQPPVGAAVVAGAQTEGRGRRGRTWWMQPGDGLAVSYLLPMVGATAPGLFSLLAGVAVVAAVERVTGVRLSLKWPNDALWEGRKVAGVLIETVVRGGGQGLAVVGIGVNVRGVAPPAWGKAATLEEASGRPFEPQELWAALALALEQGYETWIQLGREALLEAWRTYCDTLGQPVQILGPQETLEGIAEAVDGEGALWVRTPRGLYRVTAGEVSLRPRRA